MDDYWEQRAEEESSRDMRLQVRAVQERLARMSPEEREEFERLWKIANSANPPNPLGRVPERAATPSPPTPPTKGRIIRTFSTWGYPTTATTIVREGKDPLGHSN